MEILESYMNLPFVQNAFIVAIFISICSALLGVVLVLRKFSFIGDSLSHVAFSAMAIATVIKLSDIGINSEYQETFKMVLTLVITVICAIVLLQHKKNSLLSGDAKLAIVSVSSLAVGYVLMNKFSNSTNVSADVCTSLFGSTSILTLTDEEVILSIILSIVVIMFYLFFYNKILAITYDESFMISIGVNVDFYNICLSIITAVVIVLSMNLVGSLLISALIIFPVITSMLIFKTFKQVVISSVFYAIICTLAGLLFSIIIDAPVGSTIVILDVIIYFIIFIIKKLLRRS